jgi:exosome complex RNA-binding protein Rrp4
VKLSLEQNKKAANLKMENSDPIVCFPGDRLFASSENTIAGVGTYERCGYIYSSLAGIVETKVEEKVSLETACSCQTIK